MTSVKPEWVSIKEYAAIYGIHRNTVRKWIDNDLLLTYKVGTIVRVRNIPPAPPQRSNSRL